MKNRRSLILKEASEIIAEEGMEKFTLSVLASRSGITKATLYSYFSSKDEIVNTIIEDGHRRLMKKGFRISLSGSVEEVLIRASLHWKDIFLSEEDSLWLRIIFSTHLVNSRCGDEYRSIRLMLKSQTDVMLSSFALAPAREKILSELFASLLLSRLESTLEGDEADLAEDIRGFASIVEDLR